MEPTPDIPVIPELQPGERYFKYCIESETLIAIGIFIGKDISGFANVPGLAEKFDFEDSKIEVYEIGRDAFINFAILLDKEKPNVKDNSWMSLTL